MPEPRTSCRQEVPFAQPPGTLAKARRLIETHRPHVIPGLPR